MKKKCLDGGLAQILVSFGENLKTLMEKEFWVNFVDEENWENCLQGEFGYPKLDE